MRQILIGKGTINYGLSTSTGDIAGAWELDKLSDGSIVCLEKDGTFVDDTLPVISNDSFYFALGRTGLPPVISPLIDIATLNWEKSVYVAPVAKVMVVGTNESGVTTYGLNLPSSPVAGTVAGIQIVDLSKHFSDNTRYHNFEHLVVTGDTATTIMNGLLAKVNADAFVTMAQIEAGKGFSFTAATAGKDFSINCSGILANADVLAYKDIVFAGTSGLTAGYANGLTTALTANVFGVGTSTEIAGLEADYSTELGNTGLQDRGVSLFTGSTRTVAGATYTKYILTWQTPNDNQLMPKNNPVQTLVIAAASGDTGAGKLCAALDAILASL